MKPRSTPGSTSRSPINKANEEFKLVFHNNAHPMWVSDVETLRFLDVNPAAVNLYGYSHAEFLKMRVPDLSDKDDSRRKTIPGRNGNLNSGKFEHCTKDGAVLHVKISSKTIIYKRHKATLAEIKPITGKQQTEKAPGQSGNDYRYLVDHSQLLISTHDLKGNLLSMNSRAIKILGYKAEDLIGRNFRTILAPEIRSNLKNYLLNVRNHGDAQGVIQVITAAGERRFWQYHNTLHNEGAAEPIVRAVAYDITERKVAEEALRLSESKYRELFDNVLDGIFRTTPDGRMISANPALVHMLGYETEEDLLSLNVESLYLDPRVRGKNIRILKSAGEMRDVETELKRRDGKTLTVLANSRSIRDSKGEIIYYEGTLTDITERKRVEEALHSSEGELRALFEAIPDLVLVLDKDGRYLNIAPTNPSLIHLPAEEILGKRMHEIFSRQKADELVGYIRKALETNKPVQFEYAQLIGNRIVWFSATTAQLTKDTVVWVARDITLQKQAEEQNQHRLGELETLYESGLVLSQTLDPRGIAKQIINVLSERLDLHHAAVRVRRGDSDEVELLALSELEDQTDLTEAREKHARNAITKIGQGMAGWVMEHGRIINSGNLPDDPRYHETFPNMLSGLYAPIWAGGRILGCISVEIDQHNAFNMADELLLTTLASQAAAALENARLFAEAQKRAAQSNTLYDATRDLTAQTDLSTLLQILAGRVATLLNSPGGGVYLYDPKLHQLEIASSTDQSLPIGTRLKLGEGMAGCVAEKREALIVHDYQSWDGRSPQYSNEPFAAVLEVPMLYRGELIGVIAAYQVHSEDSSDGKAGREFTEEDLRLASLFAASAAGAIYSARLFDSERLRREDAERLRQIALDSAERLSVLHAVTQEITGISQDPEQVYTSIHKAVSRLMPTEAFAITLLDEEHSVINGAYLFDRDGRSPPTDIPFGQGFASRVILSGETILINDVETAGIKVLHFGSPEHARSILAVPLRAGGRVIGSISAQSYQPDIYNEEDQVLLEMLAAQAAIAIQNARLYQQALRSAERQSVLHQVSQEMARLNQEPEQLYAAIHAAAARLLSADVFYIALINEAENQMEGVYAVDHGKLSPVVRFPVGSGYTGWVIENSKTLLIQDAHVPHGIEPIKFSEDGDTRSVLVVPLRLGEKVIGTMSAQSYRENQFDEEDRVMFEMLASQVAITIDNTRLFDQTSRRLNELESLTKAGEVLTGTLEMGPLLENILRAARQAIPAAEKGTILLREENEQGHLHVHAQVGYDDSHIMDLPFEDSRGYAGRAFHEKRPILIRDSLADYETPFDEKLEVANLVQSAIVAPLIVKGEAIGVVSLDNTSRKAAFDEEDLRLLGLFASSAAVVIENARLFGETRRRADEFEILFDMTRDIGAHQQDLSSLLPTLVERAAHLLSAFGGGIYLFDAQRNDLELNFSFPDRDGIGARIQLGEGAAGRVAQTQTPLIIDDYEKWLGRRPLLEGVPYRAILQVPMIYSGNLIGVLETYEYGDSSRKYNEADIKLLSLFAAHAAGAIHNTRLFDEARKTAAKFANLYETAHDLSGQNNLDDLLNLIVERAGSLLNAPISGIYLFDKARNDLHVAVNRGLTTSLGIRLGMGEGVAGRVAQSRQPLIIEDYQVWEGGSPYYKGVPLRSILEVPMLYGGELIGVLTVDEIGDSERKFTQDDASLLSLFASQAAAVVYSARLFEKISQRAGEFEALYQTASDLSAQSDLTTLLNTIIQRAWVLTGAAGAGFYLFDKERGDLELVAIHDPDVKPGIRLDLGEGISGRVAESRQPLLVNNYAAWGGGSPKYKGVPHTSILAVPMLYSGELIGVLNVFNRADQNREGPPPEFTEQDIHLTSLFANAAAGAVYGARLLDQTRQRVEELDAIARVSSALRTAATRAEITPIILAQLQEILQADGASFLRLNPVTHEIDNELSQGSLEPLNGFTIPAGTGISAQVIKSREIYSTPNLHADPRVFSPQLVEKARSTAIVPLVSQDIALGVLWVTRDEKAGIQPPAFDERDLRILSAIADITANAIHRVSLYEQTTHYAEQLVTVNAIGRDLSETLDLPGIYEKAAHSAIDLFPDTATVTISLYDPQAKTITAVYGLQNGDLIDVTVLPARSLTETEVANQREVILKGRPFIVPDLNDPLNDAWMVKDGNVSDQQPIQSAIYVPMKAEGRVIGVLQLESYVKYRYTSTDAELLELAANTVAGAIQNTRLFTQLKRRVDQLSALHAVDNAIGTTTDLRVSLQAVLENITRQLQVDAADVLLLNPSTLILQYAAGVGFLTSEIMHTSLSIGRGQAGKAALERQIVHVPDLNAESAGFLRANLISAERFEAYLVVPLTAKGEVKGVLEIFQRGPLDMDEERKTFLEMLAGQAALAIDNALMFESLEKANVELIMAYDATIEGWSQALELRDQETQGHSARVLELTLQLAAAMDLRDKESQDIRRGVLLHDIGKMGIPDSILHKPGQLTDEEWEIMRKHPQYAFDMLAPIVYLRNSLDIPYCHHEKWDGTGYPRRLKGETIPLSARIFSIVDVYDALTSDRPYRKAWSREKTIEYIIEQSGKHFDPRVVDVFLNQINN